MTNIRQAVEKLANPNPTLKGVIGTFKSVDLNAKTCDVSVEEGYDRLEVRLTAEENQSNTGFIIEPKVGSWVYIQMQEDNDAMWFVSMVSEVASVLLKNDSEASLLLKDNGETHLHGGQFKGLVKLDKVQANIDSLKNYVEAMNAALPIAFTAIGAAMSANGASGGSSYSGAMSALSVSFQNMENPKVKHG